MTNGLNFDRKTAEIVRTPPTKTSTSPWVATGWLLFGVLLCISPALVWAGWALLT